MKKLAIVLLGLAVGAGVLWYTLDQGRAPEPTEATSPITAPPTSGAAGTSAPVTVDIPRIVEHVRSVSTVQTLEGQTKVARARQTLMQVHPDLATELNLSSEQARDFFELLARQEVEISEATSANRISALELAAEAEQAALLAGKYEQWQEYQDAELGRGQVDQLEIMLGGQGLSLSSDQTSPLVNAIAAEQQRANKELLNTMDPRDIEPRAMLQLQLQSATVNNRLLVEIASRHLFPTQVAVYEQLLQQRVRAMERKLRKMDRETR